MLRAWGALLQPSSNEIPCLIQLYSLLIIISTASTATQRSCNTIFWLFSACRFMAIALLSNSVGELKTKQSQVRFLDCNCASCFGLCGSIHAGYTNRPVLTQTDGQAHTYLAFLLSVNATGNNFPRRQVRLGTSASVAQAGGEEVKSPCSAH